MADDEAGGVSLTGSDFERQVNEALSGLGPALFGRRPPIDYRRQFERHRSDWEEVNIQCEPTLFGHSLREHILDDIARSCPLSRKEVRRLYESLNSIDGVLAVLDYSARTGVHIWKVRDELLADGRIIDMRKPKAQEVTEEDDGSFLND